MDGGEQNAALQWLISDLAEREAEPERHLEPSRRQHERGHLRQTGHDYRGQSPLLEYPCNQSHGLVACGSDGREDHAVDVVLEEHVGDRRGRVPDQTAGGEDRSLDRRMTRSRRADGTV
jgi:hypothetical protein